MPIERSTPGQTVNVLAWIAQALGWRITSHNLPPYVTADMKLPEANLLTVTLTSLQVAPLPPDLSAKVHTFLARCYRSSVEAALQRAVPAERVAAWRKSHHHTLKEAAAAVGVGVPTLKRYETGRSRPRLPQVLWLWNAVNGRPRNAPPDWGTLADAVAISTYSSKCRP